MGKRIVIVPFSWLINLQKEIENILGPEGDYVLIRNASFQGGAEFAKDSERLFGHLPLEHKIRGYLQLSSLTG